MQAQIGGNTVANPNNPYDFNGVQVLFTLIFNYLIFLNHLINFFPYSNNPLRHRTSATRSAPERR